jgi:hypothetical protein
LHRPIVSAALLSLSLLAQPALATDVYECSFADVGSNYGFIPLIAIITHDAETDAATVFDPIIKQEKGAPIAATVSANNKAKLSVSWSMMLGSGNGDYVKMAYRLSLQKASLAASVSGKPQGYINDLRAEGSCKRIKG